MGILSAIPAVQAVKKGALIVVAVAVFLLASALLVQTLRISYLQSDLARTEETVKAQGLALDLAEGANASTVAANEKLVLANEEWAKEARTASALADQAVAESSRARLSASVARSQASARLKQEANSNAECGTLLSQDLGAVCPALRQRLLDHSAKLRPH